MVTLSTRLLPQRRARRVQGGVAAAHDADAPAGEGLAALVEGLEEADGGDHPLGVLPLEAEAQGPVRAEGDEDRLEALVQEAVEGDVAAEGGVAAQRDVLVEEGVDLPLQGLPRQAVAGDGGEEHAARPRVLLEDRHPVPLEGEVVGRGEAGGAGADHRHRGKVRPARRRAGTYVRGSTRSVTKRLRARMATGLPPWAPARQRSSQGWLHTRAHTDGNGLASRIAR